MYLEDSVDLNELLAIVLVLRITSLHNVRIKDIYVLCT